MSSLTYDTVEYIAGVNLEKYVYGLSEAGLSTRSGEPITIDIHNFGNKGDLQATGTPEGVFKEAKSMTMMYLTVVHAAELLIRTGSCTLKD